MRAMVVVLSGGLGPHGDETAGRDVTCGPGTGRVLPPCDPTGPGDRYRRSLASPGCAGVPISDPAGPGGPRGQGGDAPVPAGPDVVFSSAGAPPPRPGRGSSRVRSPGGPPAVRRRAPPPSRR